MNKVNRGRRESHGGRWEAPSRRYRPDTQRQRSSGERRRPAPFYPREVRDDHEPKKRRPAAQYCTKWAAASQTDISVDSSLWSQTQAGRLSMAYPRILTALATQYGLWSQYRAAKLTPAAAVERLTAMLRLLVLNIAIEIDPFFIEKHSGLEDSDEGVWQVLEEERTGVCFHFLVHRQGNDVFALDFLQWRTEEWPYGVRFCGWEKH